MRQRRETFWKLMTLYIPGNRLGIYDPPYHRDVDSMTPSIRGGMESMTPPIGGVWNLQPRPHLLVAPPPGGN